MSSTRIKICGFTRTEDAVFAARAGADAIGLIFYAASPRAVTVERAIEIAAALPPFVSTVALFVNESAGVIEKILAELQPTLLQFHGDEDETYCAQFGVPYLKAVRVGAGMGASDLLKWQAQFHSAKALLLDTLSAGVYGGSGKTFDWELIPPELRSLIVLSGGLDATNVRAAVKEIGPWAVDVSSGVEGAEKGIKDHRKITQFIEAVKHANAG